MIVPEHEYRKLYEVQASLGLAMAALADNDKSEAYRLIDDSFSDASSILKECDPATASNN